MKIEVFDLLGRRVRVLVDENLQADFHSIGWDLTDSQGKVLHPGVYMYRMEAASFRDQKKMLLLGN